MAALFSPRSNTLFRVALGALLALGIAVPAGAMLFVRTPYVTRQDELVIQPVAFDHRHHVGDDGIDCRYCHDLVERSPSAGVPPTERCLNCHNQVWNQSPKLAPVWQSYASGRPIPWVRVHQLGDFVYFNHSAHVNGGVACVTCHGRVDRMASVYQVVPLTMQWCVDCHRDPLPRLGSPARVTEMVPDLQDAGRPPPAVHPGTNCSTCHR